MGKKSKRQRSSKARNQRQEGAREAPPLRSTAPKEEEEEETRDNLRFEDPFADVYEDEDVVLQEKAQGGNGEDEEEEEEEAAASTTVRAWNPISPSSSSLLLEPGQKNHNRTQLEMDPTAYKMHHSLAAAWPCLSFDFCHDPWGAAPRTRFPHSLLAVVGTQAPNKNTVTLLKLSDLTKMQVETEDDILGEEYNPHDNDDESSSSSDDDDDDDDEELDLDPVMEHFDWEHKSGAVNRLRVMPQQHIVATWSDSGQVHLYNLQPMVDTFCCGTSTPSSSSASSFRIHSNNKLPTITSSREPIFTFSGHSTEGFALDWSPGGNLVTGDNAGDIYQWQAREDDSNSWTVTPLFRGGNKESVEDLQWSPNEATVVAAAHGSGWIRIYDTRAPGRAMISQSINNADINVASWNPRVTNLLATGSDDGTLCVWDLRHFQKEKQAEPLARFSNHKSPLTSVEWHPTDESMLAVSDDWQTYIYDLSIEEDYVSSSKEEEDVPPQLLFVDCSSQYVKELHWHPQITSCLMTTAQSGFTVFIPSNL